MILNELMIKGKAEDIRSTILKISIHLEDGFLIELKNLFSKDELKSVNLSNKYNIIKLNTADTLYFFTDKAVPSLPLKLSKKYPTLTFNYMAIDRNQREKIIMRVVRNIKGNDKGGRVINDMSVIEPDSFHGMKLYELVNEELEKKILKNMDK